MSPFRWVWAASAGHRKGDYCPTCTTPPGSRNSRYRYISPWTLSGLPTRTALLNVIFAHTTVLLGGPVIPNSWFSERRPVRDGMLLRHGALIRGLGQRRLRPRVGKRNVCFYAEAENEMYFGVFFEAEQHSIYSAAEPRCRNSLPSSGTHEVGALVCVGVVAASWVAFGSME